MIVITFVIFIALIVWFILYNCKINEFHVSVFFAFHNLSVKSLGNRAAAKL